MWLCLVHSSSGNAGTSSAPVLSTYSHCGYPTLLFTMPNLCMGTSGTLLQYAVVDRLGAFFYQTRYMSQQCTVQQYHSDLSYQSALKIRVRLTVALF